MKHELGGRLITEPAALTSKTYSYLTDDTMKTKSKRRRKYES